MTASDTRSAGRRLTPDEEQRGAEMFAAGASDSQVAEALGCGRATANRLRHRTAAAAAAGPQPGGQDAPGTPVTPEPPELSEAPEALSALRDRAEQLAAQHADLTGKAAAVREQVEDLDARRIEALAGGGDSASFATERTRLEAEHARLTADAALVAGWLAEASAAVGRREAEHRLGTQAAAACREEAAGRVLAGDAATVLREAAEAVRAAAARLVTYRRDLAAAQDRVAAAYAEANQTRALLGQAVVPVPVLQAAALPDSPGRLLPGAAGGHAALARSWELAGRAAAGQQPVHPSGVSWSAGTPVQAAGIASELAAAGDVYELLDAWAADTPERERRQAELAAQHAADLERLRKAQARGPGGPGRQERGWPGPEHVTDVDEHGHPLWPDPPQRVPDRNDAWPGTPPATAYGVPVRGW